ADLYAAAAYRLIARVIGRQAHARPGLERGALDIAPALHVVLERSAVVEKVEPDQLDPLVLEVDQRAVDAAPVARGPGGPGRCVAGGVVVTPVDPGYLATRGGLVATTAPRGARLDLAQKPPVSGRRDGTNPTAELVSATDQAGRETSRPLTGTHCNYQGRSDQAAIDPHSSPLVVSRYRRRSDGRAEIG